MFWVLCFESEFLMNPSFLCCGLKHYVLHVQVCSTPFAIAWILADDPDSIYRKMLLLIGSVC